MDRKEYLREIENTIAAGPYSDTWESLERHPLAGWYEKGRLGIFLHWGVYSVPAYHTEWYPRLMYYKQNPVHWHHKKKYGKSFDYHEFIPLFKAERFEAAAWAEAFAKCGADFVMPVAEHHDGFKMYKSELSEWNAAQMGPERDVLGELKESVEARGMRIAASSHRAEHLWFMNGGRTVGYENATLSEDTRLREFYGPCENVKKKNNILSFVNLGKGITPSEAWLEDWLLSSCELVDRYRPSAFYFDFWTAEESFRPYMRKFLAYYYNRAAQWGQEVVSFYKSDAALRPCGVYVRERGQMDGMSRDVWQCETSTAYNAWSYCTTNKFKRVEEIACNMVDVWSKNGRMALNFGPKADGTLCEEELRILQTLAPWLQKNREAIWNAAPYRVYGEGKKQKSGSFREKYRYKKRDFRFTYKMGSLYAFALAPKGQKTFRIKTVSQTGSCNAIVKDVRILGCDAPVAFKAKFGHLELTLGAPVQDSMPLCFKITLI